VPQSNDSLAVRIDAGKQTKPITTRCRKLAGEAMDALSEQIEALAGRSFYGTSGIELAWEDGQIVELRLPVKSRRR